MKKASNVILKPDPSSLTVAIMAGGKSSRMGREKSLVSYLGRPMLATVIERVTGLGDELILISNKPDVHVQFGLPLFSDIYPDRGPLGGIFTAVQQAKNTHTLVVACDMPWLNRPLLEHMISLRESADIIVPRWTKFPEPLHAIYNKACLPAIEANLKAKQLKIISFYGNMSVRFVDREEIERFDEDGRSFANINTPQDLENGKSESES